MKSDLQAILDSMGVTMTSKHVRLIATGGWHCDVWECTVSYEGKTHTTEFQTGLGHRKLLAIVERSGKGYYNSVRGAYARDLADACEQGWAKPVAPSSADVISFLASDAMSAEETFESWCSNFGYDTDSRKAFAMYQAGMATRDAMVRLFGAATLQEIASAEH